MISDPKLDHVANISLMIPDLRAGRAECININLTIAGGIAARVLREIENSE